MQGNGTTGYGLPHLHMLGFLIKAIIMMMIMMIMMMVFSQQVVSLKAKLARGHK